MLLFGPKNDVIFKKKKVFTEILTFFSRAHGPPKLHEPRGHCSPLPPPLGGPDYNSYEKSY